MENLQSCFGKGYVSSYLFVLRFSGKTKHASHQNAQSQATKLSGTEPHKKTLTFHCTGCFMGIFTIGDPYNLWGSPCHSIYNWGFIQNQLFNRDPGILIIKSKYLVI